MINAVGREIPDEILQKMKKPAFTGAYSPKKDVIIRTTAKSRCAAIEKGKTAESKLLVSIEDVIEKTGIKDGMTISFHHHMRNEGLDPENPKHRSEHYKRLRIDEKILGEILSGISRAFGNYITDDEAEMFLVKCEESLEEHEKKSK